MSTFPSGQRSPDQHSRLWIALAALITLAVVITATAVVVIVRQDASGPAGAGGPTLTIVLVGNARGRALRVAASPSIDVDALKPGQLLLLNEALNVVDACDFEVVGDVVMLKEVLADGERALVIAQADEERVVRIAWPLLDQVLRAGDLLLLEPRSGYVYEKIPKSAVTELILEECRTSGTATSADCGIRSVSSVTPSSFRISIATSPGATVRAARYRRIVRSSTQTARTAVGSPDVPCNTLHSAITEVRAEGARPDPASERGPADPDR